MGLGNGFDWEGRAYGGVDAYLSGGEGGKAEDPQQLTHKTTYFSRHWQPVPKKRGRDMSLEGFLRHYMVQPKFYNFVLNKIDSKNVLTK